MDPLLNGAKRWIGLASIADIAVIWAATDEGIRGFLVPTDTAGFTATPIEQKLSMRASIQCDIDIAHVQLPAEAVLPDVRGLKGPFSSSTRPATESCGAQWAPLAISTRWP